MAGAIGVGTEFKQFLLKNNVLALALGVVIGAAMGDVVKSIVDDLLGGIVGAISVDRDMWAALNFRIWRFEVRLGNFASVALKFVIVAGVVFGLTKLFLKTAAPPPTKTCPECREGIHPEASRCKFCTAVQPGPAESA